VEDLALEQMSRATREMAWKLRSAASNPAALGPQTRARGGSGVSVGAWPPRALDRGHGL